METRTTNPESSADRLSPYGTGTKPEFGSSAVAVSTGAACCAAPFALELTELVTTAIGFVFVPFTRGREKFHAPIASSTAAAAARDDHSSQRRRRRVRRWRCRVRSRLR